VNRHQLGEFEEVVMLTVGILYKRAYGVAIIDEMEQRLDRKVSIGALQTVLRRLEDKGYLTSELGEATNVRGGKRKRYFSLTTLGSRVLRESQEQRIELYNAIPRVAFPKS
jgi:DNA-binding PadR family transcriptional regulator